MGFLGFEVLGHGALAVGDEKGCSDVGVIRMFAKARDLEGGLRVWDGIGDGSCGPLIQQGGRRIRTRASIEALTLSRW